MQLQLKSRLIDAIGYDEETRVLTVHLSNGHRRFYGNVPQNVAIELAEASSPGTYYVNAVRSKFEAH